MTFEWKRLDPLTNEIPAYGWDQVMGMDPAANWLSGPGKRRFIPFLSLENVKVPLAVSLFYNFTDGADDRIDIKREIARLKELGHDIPPELEATLEQFGGDEVKLGSLPANLFDLSSKESQNFIDSFNTPWLPTQLAAALSSPHAPDIPGVVEIESPEKNPSIPTDGWPSEGPNGNNSTVVMGVIDDAICFAHEAFRDADDRSRIHAFWEQAGEPDGSVVPFGRELLKEPGHGIDKLLEDAKLPSQQIDEETLYKTAGFIDFSKGTRQLAALRFTHGTHVLDIAAGHHPSDNRTDRPIVAVQLPPEVVEQSSGSEMDLYAISAIDYILSRAEWLAADGEPLPVVITMSYGFIAGPHDGTTRLEKAIDLRLEAYRKKHDVQAELVLSAGNSHLSRCHARFAFEDIAAAESLSTKKSVLLEWRILPDDKTDSFVEIWLPFDGEVKYNPKLGRNLLDDDRIQVRVTSPSGAQSGWVTGVNGHTERLVPVGAPAASNAAVAEVKYLFSGGDTNRAMFRITVGPTATLEVNSASPDAPAGIWKIEIEQLRIEDCAPVECWVQRDDTIYGYPQRGRQSYFENGGYNISNENGIPIVEDDDASPDALVRRRSLISAMATGKAPIVVGAYDAKDNRPADYSSGGPVTAPATDPRPHVLGIGDWSRVGYGILAAGGKSGSVVASDGTSAAAPYVARLLAEWIVTDSKSPGLEHAKTQAEDNETNLPPDAPELSDERSGWGRVPAAGAERRIRSEQLRGNEPL